MTEAPANPRGCSAFPLFVICKVYSLRFTVYGLQILTLNFSDFSTFRLSHPATQPLFHPVTLPLSHSATLLLCFQLQMTDDRWRRWGLSIFRTPVPCRVPFRSSTPVLLWYSASAICTRLAWYSCPPRDASILAPARPLWISAGAHWKYPATGWYCCCLYWYWIAGYVGSAQIENQIEPSWQKNDNINTTCARHAPGSL